MNACVELVGAVPLKRLRAIGLEEWNQKRRAACDPLPVSFPTLCQTHLISRNFKSGEANNMGSYRPISVLNCRSKIIERNVFNTIYSFLTEENLFHKRQSGFRHNHSTATAMIHLTDKIYQDMDESTLTR